MVEGLARLITARKAGLAIFEESYDYYVRAYEALAEVTGVDIEALWTRLWEYPTGRVRFGFLDSLDELREGAVGLRLTIRQRKALGRTADLLFDADRASRQPDDVDLLRRLWRAALQ